MLLLSGVSHYFYGIDLQYLYFIMCTKYMIHIHAHVYKVQIQTLIGAAEE